MYIYFTLASFLFFLFFMHVLPCICNISINVCHIDIIGMVVANSPLEKTRNRGTAKRKILLCDREYVFHELIFKTYLLMCFIWLILTHM